MKSEASQRFSRLTPYTLPLTADRTPFPELPSSLLDQVQYTAVALFGRKGHKAQTAKGCTATRNIEKNSSKSKTMDENLTDTYEGNYPVRDQIKER